MFGVTCYARERGRVSTRCSRTVRGTATAVRTREHHGVVFSEFAERNSYTVKCQSCFLSAVPITFVCLMPLQQSALQHSVFRWTTFKTLRLMISSMGMDTHSKRAACTTLPVYHLLVDMILGTITAQASHRAQSMWQDIKLWKPERTRSEQLSALADVPNRFKAASQHCKKQNPQHPRYLHD